MGTVISAIPLLPEGTDELALFPKDFKEETKPEESLTLSEFEERYGQ